MIDRKSNIVRYLSAASSAIALAVVLGPTASFAAVQNEPAAEEDEPKDEVVVTARRRPELLQDYAGAANVFNDSALEDARVVGLGDIVNRISNAYFEERPGSQINITIRGAGTFTNGSATRTDSAIGLYYDGVYSYIQGSRIPILFYDLDRIEVFKGPQGGLYGRNAVGGAVIAHTATPKDEFSASANVEYGSFNAITFQGHINAPLSDSLSFRLSGYLSDRDSYYENVDPTLNELGDRASAVRARLRYNPNDQLDWILGYERIDELAGPQILVPPQFGEEHISVSDTDSKTDRGTNRFISLLTWAPFENAEIKSITGYTSIDEIQSSDLNNLLVHPTFGPFIGIQAFGSDAYQFNQDLTLASTGDNPFQWLVGLSYFKDQKDGTSEITSGFESLGLSNSFTTNELGIQVFSAFADASFDITDRLTVGASLRYSSEEREGDFSNSDIINPDNGMPFPGGGFAFTEKYDQLSPGGSITYHWTDDVMTYFKVATGYQSGGVNRRARGPDFANFGPSTAVSYEAGLRSAWFDDAVTANVTVFRMIQDDYQYQLLSQPREFVNAGKARIKGVEAELIFNLHDYVTIPLTYGYLDPLLIEASDSINDALGPIGDGQRLSGIPEHTGSVGLHIDAPISNNDSFYLHGNFTLTRNRTILGGTDLDDFETFDVKSGFVFNDRYEIYFYGKNLLDDIHIITPGGLGGSNIISPPRTLGVGLGFTY